MPTKNKPAPKAAKKTTTSQKTESHSVTETPVTNQGQSSKPAKKLSQIEAALQVLKNAKEPMSCKQMVEAMVAKKLWTSPGGKTPEATLRIFASGTGQEGRRRSVRQSRTRAVRGEGLIPTNDPERRTT